MANYLLFIQEFLLLLLIICRVSWNARVSQSCNLCSLWDTTINTRRPMLNCGRFLNEVMGVHSYSLKSCLYCYCIPNPTLFTYFRHTDITFDQYFLTNCPVKCLYKQTYRFYILTTDTLLHTHHTFLHRCIYIYIYIYIYI